MKYEKMYRITSSEHNKLHNDACLALSQLREEALPHADHMLNCPGQWSQYYYVRPDDTKTVRDIELTVDYLRNTIVGDLGKLEIIPWPGSGNELDEYRVRFTHKDFKVSRPW